MYSIGDVCTPCPRRRPPVGTDSTRWRTRHLVRGRLGNPQPALPAQRPCGARCLAAGRGLASWAIDGTASTTAHACRMALAPARAAVSQSGWAGAADQSTAHTQFAGAAGARLAYDTADGGGYPAQSAHRLVGGAGLEMPRRSGGGGLVAPVFLRHATATASGCAGESIAGHCGDGRPCAAVGLACSRAAAHAQPCCLAASRLQPGVARAAGGCLQTEGRGGCSHGRHRSASAGWQAVAPVF